jgi:hypothetical protein
MAAPPPVQIQSIHPSENGVLQVARIAPYVKGAAARWRIRSHLIVKNNGLATIKVKSTALVYPAGPTPLGTAVEDTNDKPEIDSRDIAPGKTGVVVVEDGMARPGGEGIDRELFFPVPPNVQVHVGFVGFNETAVRAFPLQAYVNKTPQGSYLFPAKHADLASGEHWSGGGSHAFTRTQKFAYDFGVSRWDKAAKTWTGLVGTDKSDVEDYLVWGKGVYAMASGTIVKCTWSHPDNKNVGADDHGVNGVVIDHGNGEFSHYAHLQQNSLDPELCKIGWHAESTYGVNMPVAAGQFLGLAGNSGSTHPHLHVQLSQGANGKPFSGNSQSGLPLLFRAARNVSGIDKAMIGPGPFDYNTMNGQIPGGPFNLINLGPLPWVTP